MIEKYRKASDVPWDDQYNPNELVIPPWGGKPISISHLRGTMTISMSGRRISSALAPMDRSGPRESDGTIRRAIEWAESIRRLDSNYTPIKLPWK